MPVQNLSICSLLWAQVRENQVDIKYYNTEDWQPRIKKEQQQHTVHNNHAAHPHLWPPTVISPPSSYSSSLALVSHVYFIHPDSHIRDCIHYWITPLSTTAQLSPHVSFNIRGIFLVKEGDTLIFCLMTLKSSCCRTNGQWQRAQIINILIFRLTLCKLPKMTV